MPKAEFGRAYREARMSRSLSLRQVADEAGCSAAFLSEIELGTRRASPRLASALVKIIRERGVDVRALVGLYVDDWAEWADLGTMSELCGLGKVETEDAADRSR